jgi:predicted DNA-binding transcriptional regulator AlpA
MDNLNQITQEQNLLEKTHDNMMYLGDVLSKFKVSRPTLYRRIKAGEIPAPIDRYNKRSAWRKDQIEEVYEKKFLKFK